jgi:predicted transcriptional regulator of viral defense system
MSKEAKSVPSGLPFVFRARDVMALGLSRNRMQTWLRRGEIERVGRGLYRIVYAPFTEWEGLAAVATIVPNGILCLLTALRVHEIGTQSPGEVWMAIDRKAWIPDTSPWKVRFVRWSGRMLRYGIETRVVEGVTIRITSPARTIVDCFRYRNKIGLDVALEALEDGLRDRKTTVTAVMKAAEACRARTVIRPYLESLAR